MPIHKDKLRVVDIMSVDPVCVEANTGIRELARLFEEHQISGAPVVDQAGKVIGVVSRTDLIRRCSEGIGDAPPAYLFEIVSARSPAGASDDLIPTTLVCVQDIMTEDVFAVDDTMYVTDLAEQMHKRRMHRAIVVDQARFPLGIVTSLDIVGAYSRAVSS